MRWIVPAAALAAALGCSRPAPPAPGPGGTDFLTITNRASRDGPGKALAVGEAPVLRVDSPAGSVVLEAGGEAEIVTRTVLRAPGEEDLDRIRVSVEKGEDGVVRLGWTAEGDRSGLSVDFTVSAPPGTDVGVATGAGTVRVSGFRKGLLARTGGGSVEVRGVEGALDLETGAGIIEVADGKGALRAKTGGGSVSVENGAGDLRLETGAGVLRVTGGAGKVHARTGGGSIEVRGRTGDLDLETMAGTVEVKAAAGSVRAETGGGTVTLEGSLSGDCLAKTGAGSVALRLPGDASLVVEGRTAAGSVSTDFPLLVEGKYADKRVSGTLGDGKGGSLRVETGGGSLEIRRK